MPGLCHPTKPAISPHAAPPGPIGLLLRAGCAAELACAAVALAVAAASGGPGVTHGTLGLAGGEFGEGVTDAVACLLAVALGTRNAVARRLAVPDLTTTVLTMTLTGLGADIRAVLGEGARVRGAARPAARFRASASPPPAGPRAIALRASCCYQGGSVSAES